MAKKKLNIAMIGAAFMGKAHSNAFRQVKAFFDLPVEPVMKVMCRRSKKDDGLAQQLGWEESSHDWREVVAREDIDVIDISTPNYLHPQIALEAAKHGKHIICEKPLANTLKDAEAMLAAVKKAGVKHQCCFTYRFAPAVQTIKKMIGEGTLGDIFHFRACYLQDWIVDPNFPMVWRLRRKDSGSGTLGDIGAHITDLCQFLVGPVDEVTGTLRTFLKRRPVSEDDTGISGARVKEAGKMATVDVDDAAAFIGRIKGKATLATFEATRFAPGRRNFNSIEIYGSKGSVLWNQEDMNEFQYFNREDPGTLQGFRRVFATDGGHPYTDAWWPAGHVIGYEHLFVHTVYEFFRQLDAKKPTYATFEDAVAVQRVLDAVERSAASRKWESVK